LYESYHKLNGEHHCFIMNVKEVLNRFFHVYVINVIVITCEPIFGHTLYAFTLFVNLLLLMVVVIAKPIVVKT
jgi:hypothetical protein